MILEQGLILTKAGSPGSKQAPWLRLTREKVIPNQVVNLMHALMFAVV